MGKLKTFDEVFPDQASANRWHAMLREIHGPNPWNWPKHARKRLTNSAIQKKDNGPKQAPLFKDFNW